MPFTLAVEKNIMHGAYFNSKTSINAWTKLSIRSCSFRVFVGDEWNCYYIFVCLYNIEGTLDTIHYIKWMFLIMFSWASRTIDIIETGKQANKIVDSRNDQAGYCHTGQQNNITKKSYLCCINGGIMWFICMWPGYIPEGTGPMGVGSIPGVTDDGPAPSYTKHKTQNENEKNKVGTEIVKMLHNFSFTTHNNINIT